MKVNVGKKNIKKFEEILRGECFKSESGNIFIKACAGPFLNEKDSFGVMLENGRVVEFKNDEEVEFIELECVEV